jgi:hypothetical protein
MDQLLRIQERMSELEAINQRYERMMEFQRVNARTYQRRRYHEDPDFKKKCIEKARQYYEQNKDKIIERNKLRRRSNNS